MPGHHHIFLTMTELRYGVTVHVLPMYVPSQEERDDPALYAENVRQVGAGVGREVVKSDSEWQSGWRAQGVEGTTSG